MTCTIEELARDRDFRARMWAGMALCRVLGQVPCYDMRSAGRYIATTLAEFVVRRRQIMMVADRNDHRQVDALDAVRDLDEDIIPRCLEQALAIRKRVARERNRQGMLELEVVQFDEVLAELDVAIAAAKGGA